MWRDIPGWEGYYQVSDQGEVMSLPRPRAQLRVLRAAPVGNGYLAVNLHRNGSRKQRKVHQLVLEAFRGPRPSGLVARHLNGNKLDNRLENLEWGTWSENNGADKHLHGTMAESNKTHCLRNHPFDTVNTRIGVSGQRICRQCTADRQRRYRAERKERKTS